MTLPRAAYRYGPQRVSAADGSISLQSNDEAGTITLTCDGRQSWHLTRREGSAKQLFVSDEGRVAVLGADDVITFYTPAGASSGRVALLELVPETALSNSSAGRVWDDYVAGAFDGKCFVVDGRGAPPLVFDSDTGATIDLPLARVRQIQRQRGLTVLEQAHAQLSAGPAGARAPWRLAAVGWARVAALAHDERCVGVLEHLGALVFASDGRSLLSLLGFRCARDPVLVARYALDPLRQATNCALLRLGHSAAAVTTSVCRRRGLLQANDWLGPRRPADWLTALGELRPDASPSDVLARLGTPMHIERTEAGIQWSYHHLTDAGAQSSDLLWGRRGLAASTTCRLPEASPWGLVA